MITSGYPISLSLSPSLPLSPLNNFHRIRTITRPAKTRAVSGLAGRCQREISFGPFLASLTYWWSKHQDQGVLSCDCGDCGDCGDDQNKINPDIMDMNEDWWETPDMTGVVTQGRARILFFSWWDFHINTGYVLPCSRHIICISEATLIQYSVSY